MQEPESEGFELPISIVNELVKRGAFALGGVPEIDDGLLLIDRWNHKLEILQGPAADVLNVRPRGHARKIILARASG